ncbi:MAG: PadR family transcriptional regulator [Exiguobacterium sp.]|nr:PadR family transcriptional regulator [Exiguobacterium sp.]
MPRTDSLELGELTDSMFYILLTLTTPRHGYLVMHFVEETTRGRMQIGPASMYTIIKKLLNAELIESMDEDGKKKSYRITNKGRLIVTKVGENSPSSKRLGAKPSIGGR